MARTCNYTRVIVNRTAHFPDPAKTPVLTVTEAAGYLGLSRDAAYRGVNAGDIPSIRVGRRIMVPTARLAEMLGLARTEQ